MKTENLISIDKIAIGSIILLGGRPHKKLSPYICQDLTDGSLAYDARMYSGWEGSPPPMVEFIPLPAPNDPE